MGASFAVCAVAYRIVIGFARYAYTGPMREAAHIPPEPGSLNQLARAALPVGVVNVFGSLVYTVQSPMLGFLLGPEKVAPFYLAQKIAMACNTLAMQTALPQLPFFTRALGAGNIVQARSNMKTVIVRATVFLIASSAAFYFLSPIAARVLLHREAYVDKFTLSLMTLDLLLLGASVVWAQFVLASGRNPFVLPTIVNGTLALTLSVYLIPTLGVAALPAATIISGLILNYRLSLVYGIKTMYSLTLPKI